MNINLNGKKFDKPNFFTISNLGGGGSDKYRETVYLDLLENTSTLYNYFYLVQYKIPKTMSFATPWLKNINNYDTFAEFIKYVRESMIKDKNYYSDKHEFESYDYDKTVYLLDSGAANFINVLHKNIDYNKDKSRFKQEIINIMKSYYDFADRFKFDIVIGFDLGGKYTFKGDEIKDNDIIEKNKEVKNDSFDLNAYILEETIKYIKNKSNFYPKIYATVHGNGVEEYRAYTELILQKEIEYGFKFDGFALGGIASAIGKDLKLWNVSDESMDGLNKLIKNQKSISTSEAKNAIISSIACKVVKDLVKDRDIHALGAGGRLNIIPLYYAGATSFDTQTPGRRAYDGSGANIGDFYNPNKGQSFSKYLPGMLDNKLEIINKDENISYIQINKIKNDIELCGCCACNKATIAEVKDFYCDKNSNENYYYSRQLINSHAIHQHNYICRLIQKNKDIDMILKELGRDDDMEAIIKYIIDTYLK